MKIKILVDGVTPLAIGPYIGLTELPRGLPKTRTGHFECQCNELDSLNGISAWIGGDLRCHENKLTALGKIDFVGGNFWCFDNELTTLVDMPKRVIGDVICHRNAITSLKGMSHDVGGSFNCGFNPLTSLEGIIPNIKGSFRFDGTSIDTLHDVHKMIRSVKTNFISALISEGRQSVKSSILGVILIEIGGGIRTGLGNIGSDDHMSDVDRILNKWKNQGRKGVLGAQRELLDLGYDELAKL